MGLKLKPTKCKSLSICAGKLTEITFKLAGHELKSILHDPYHKFLGGYFTFKSTGSSVYANLREKILSGLTNIDELLIWGELKARICTL